MDDQERVDIREAARLLGLSARQVRRYRDRLGGQLEDRPITQPTQPVLTFSRAEVLRLKAERESQPVQPDVTPRPASGELNGQR